MSKTLKFSRNAEKMLRAIGRKHKFNIQAFGWLIRSNYSCPLSVAYNDKFPQEHSYNSMFCMSSLRPALASKLGISVDTLEKIVLAADNVDNEYRARLKYLLGVKSNEIHN